MNINDVKIAAEDLIEANGVSPRENVYVKGIDGAELINGFDVVETDEITGVFVLDSSGKPAVSSREYARVVSRLSEAEGLLSEAHDMLNDLHCYETQVYEDISKFLYGEEE